MMEDIYCGVWMNAREEPKFPFRWMPRLPPNECNICGERPLMILNRTDGGHYVAEIQCCGMSRKTPPLMARDRYIGNLVKDKWDKLSHNRIVWVVDEFGHLGSRTMCELDCNGALEFDYYEIEIKTESSVHFKKEDAIKKGISFLEEKIHEYHKKIDELEKELTK